MEFSFVEDKFYDKLEKYLKLPDFEQPRPAGLSFPLATEETVIYRPFVRVCIYLSKIFT
jgi:hypothetical protein